MNPVNVAFELHPQLAMDTLFICDLELCRVLLMNDARYPWCILVPRLANAREVHALPVDTQLAMWSEVGRCAERLAAQTRADKMNIAMLGNVVSQLHVHVIARHSGDAAWPRPVWGVGERVSYIDGERERVLGVLRTALALSREP